MKRPQPPLLYYLRLALMTGFFTMYAYTFLMWMFIFMLSIEPLTSSKLFVIFWLWAIPIFFALVMVALATFLITEWRSWLISLPFQAVIYALVNKLFLTMRTPLSAVIAQNSFALVLLEIAALQLIALGLKYLMKYLKRRKASKKSTIE